MKMTKGQWLLLGLGFALFVLLYFVFDTKPQSKKLSEKSRAMQMEVTGIQNLVFEARKSLDTESLALLDQANQEVKAAETNGQKSEAYKSLSGVWFQMHQKAIAGYFAEEAAKIDSTADAWGIAGTTYAMSLQDEQTSDVAKTWAHTRALQAFEQAITLDPDNVDHQINRALVYVEHPMSDQPMKGILMLRSLNEQNPDDVKVINQLARLALRTNQVDRAIERLQHALNVEPENVLTNCLMAQAYEAKGSESEAQLYKSKCIR